MSIAEVDLIKLSALTDSIDASLAAATEALSSVDVDPNYISYTIGVFPDSTGAVNGTIGSYFTSAGLLQKLEWNGTAWVTIGQQVSTKNYVDDKASLLSDKINYDTPLNLWSAEKYSGNPIISPTNEQFYPPGIIYSNGKYYLAAKSGGSIRMYVSDDGRSAWTDLGNIFTAVDVPWTTASKLESTSLRYIPEEDKYYLFSGVRHSDNVTQSVSVAVSNDIEGPYTDISTPLIDGASNTTGSVFGVATGYHEAPDMVKFGDYYYFFCTAQPDALDNDNGRIVIFRSSTNDKWNAVPYKELFTVSEINTALDRTVTILQVPAVFYYKGFFSMVFTAGVTGGGANERELYITNSKTLLGFDDLTLIDTTPYLTVGTTGSWEGMRVYGADVLKHQDGSYLAPHIIDNRLRVYYSGHALASANEGLTGLAEYRINSDTEYDDIIYSEAKKQADKSTITNKPVILPRSYSGLINQDQKFGVFPDGAFGGVVVNLPYRKELLYISNDGEMQSFALFEGKGKAVQRRLYADRNANFTKNINDAVYCDGLDKIAVIEDDLVSATLTSSDAGRVVFFNDDLTFRNSLSTATFGEGLSRSIYMPHNGYIYITTRSGKVIIVNADTEAIVDTITVATGDELGGITFDPASKKIIVVNKTDVGYHTIDIISANAVSDYLLASLPSAYSVIAVNGYIYVYALSGSDFQNMGAKINPRDYSVEYIANGLSSNGAIYASCYNRFNNTVYLFDYSQNSVKQHFLGSDAFMFGNNYGFTFNSPIYAVYNNINKRVYAVNSATRELSILT